MFVLLFFILLFLPKPEWGMDFSRRILVSIIVGEGNFEETFAVNINQFASPYVASLFWVN